MCDSEKLTGKFGREHGWSGFGIRERITEIRDAEFAGDRECKNYRVKFTLLLVKVLTGHGKARAIGVGTGLATGG